MIGDEYDLHNSPNLIHCEGCFRNISKKKGKKECLIYINNDISRKIEKRKENEFIKPYETLNNILEKNIWLKNQTEEERVDIFYNKKIEIIDNIIKANEEFINIMKNSIFERSDLVNDIKKFFIIIKVSKNKSIVDDKGKRSSLYSIAWKIRNFNINNSDDEIFFMAKYESVVENEFKIILRSLILGLMIITENSEIILGLNDNVVKVILEFINNCSNRRKIDSDYYLELLFIENFLEKNEIQLLEVDEKILDNVIELKTNLKELLKTKSITDMIKNEFELIDEALVVNEFNLIWKNKIITGGLRTWRKKIMNAIWKNEILNSEKLDDLFVYIIRRNLIGQCGDKDTRERSYRIKNMLRELPTYSILYKRDTNKINSPICIRCGKEEEVWEHVWVCEANEFSIDEIIQESPYRFELELEAHGKNKEIEILRDHLCNFLMILESPSLILQGKSRKWELIRGIFNDKFNDLSKIKEEKTTIKELWNFIYDELKKRIWIPRCEEIKFLEEKEGITKLDLKLRKQKLKDDHNEESELEKIKNNKNTKTKENKNKNKTNKIKNNQIKIVTLGKLTNAVTDGLNIDKIWDTSTKLPFY
ncbi:hypothetical protein RhiirA5_372843 [Rhizophagus irregularis]|uniref:Uncharacterized protein n=1 Tax=Rhizophagus irregularis TaxID=588596 RepID=A0A2I1DZW9_9GLOM|nr:hypothetical protein RhiirA5_372843 [Rhizophagus irregularis]PKC71235.1 hypothetical protein RhiirA1_390719 [Rhizophagus irregularis]PKY15416.1 hypothetical protein RhiirB3_380922 [Rhizophagus irregularis]